MGEEKCISFHFISRFIFFSFSIDQSLRSTENDPSEFISSQLFTTFNLKFLLIIYNTQQQQHQVCNSAPHPHPPPAMVSMVHWYYVFGQSAALKLKCA